MRKKYFFTFLAIVSFCLVTAQQTINDTILSGGLQRDYILYVPSTYSSSEATPLVINLHGYTSNAEQQFLYTRFQDIADSEKFILVCPNGTFDNTNSRFWNASFGAGVDDVGFISALIDTLSSQYNIDASKVFATGMSNGGFMSYKLACELSNRIAKIASVTGTMNVLLESTCNPANLMPIMQIHGTTDPTVPYNGGGGLLGMDDLIAYWVTKNNCNSTPTTINLTNINTTDNSTVEKLTYENTTTNNNVIFYKITNGGHTWPDGFIDLPGNGSTNRDFSATETIWYFFAGKDTVVETGLSNVYDWNGTIIQTNQTLTIKDTNPISNIQIIDALGQVLSENKSKEIFIGNLSKGIYFLLIEQNGKLYSKSFIK